MSTIARQIGKYELIEQIGIGSMGTVYSAHDPFSERLIAIKVAHAELLDQGQDGERFRRLFFNEAHAAGQLEHPNILRVYDADVDGDSCYLVMEYVPGARTLEEFCKPRNLLPVREVVGIVYKVAKALDYTHRKGIVHRDIKPSNLLLTEERDIKIADFSIAMFARGEERVPAVSGFIGSPLYMSPEQINEAPLEGTSDIFSLGIVMYQMLTGHHPFRADSLLEVTRAIMHADPPPLDSLREDLPEPLGYALRRMMKKSPQERYRTGLDLAADLAVIFEDIEETASEEAIRQRFTRIRQLGFFKGFGDADIWELIRACNWQSYSAGTAIIREEESDHSFYIVLSGVVGVIKQGRLVENLQEGDCFGEMGYLSRAKRTATVIAKTDVTVMQVNEQTIEAASEATQLRFHRVFVKILIARLTETTAMLAEASPV